jgi:hypothetical protein
MLVAIGVNDAKLHAQVGQHFNLTRKRQFFNLFHLPLSIKLLVIHLMIALPQTRQTLPPHCVAQPWPHGPMPGHPVVMGVQQLQRVCEPLQSKKAA